jgi:hypothetical protein
MGYTQSDLLPATRRVQRNLVLSRFCEIKETTLSAPPAFKDGKTKTILILDESKFKCAVKCCAGEL